MQLSGVEELSLEIAGTAEAGALPEIPPPLASIGGRRAPVSVLALRMRRLGASGLPGPRLDYQEVLYRLAVRIGDETAWLALRCDLDSVVVRALAARLIRYPVRAARISLVEREGEVSCDARSDDGAFAARVRVDHAGEEPAHRPPRRTFVASRGRLYEIPWGERAAPHRHRGVVTPEVLTACRAAFGADVELEDAVIHRGRTHLCGPAVEARLTST